jgi:hypothetical protein
MNKYLLFFIFLSSFHFSSSFKPLNQYPILKLTTHQLINRRSFIGTIPFLITKKVDAVDNEKYITQDDFIEYRVNGYLLFIINIYILFKIIKGD